MLTFGERATEWTVTFCVFNACALVLSYFHWPFDLKLDVDYESGLNVSLGQLGERDDVEIMTTSSDQESSEEED